MGNGPLRSRNSLSFILEYFGGCHVHVVNQQLTHRAETKQSKSQQFPAAKQSSFKRTSLISTGFPHSDSKFIILSLHIKLEESTLRIFCLQKKISLHHRTFLPSSTTYNENNIKKNIHPSVFHTQTINQTNKHNKLPNQEATHSNCSRIHVHFDLWNAAIIDPNLQGVGCSNWALPTQLVERLLLLFFFLFFLFLWFLWFLWFLLLFLLLLVVVGCWNPSIICMVTVWVVKAFVNWW